MMIFGDDKMGIALTPASHGLIDVSVISPNKAIRTEITLQQAIDISNQFRRYATILAAGISPETDDD
jgi:hypothetical protein